MRLQQSKMQKIKTGIHGAQALLVFVAGCLTLAVLTKSGSYGGETAFYFALCFFTIPALIYQVMVPMWSRAWRFNNVFAFAVIDILFAILWFAAAIAVAVWNANGVAKGKDNCNSSDNSSSNSDKDDEVTKRADAETCSSFGYGSESKLKVSQATVGFGIIIFLTFCAAAYISLKAVMEYRRTGVKPNAAFRKNHGQAEALATDDPGKDPWSTNTDELNHSDDRLPYGQDDQAGLLHGRQDDEFDTQQPADGMAHPGRRASWDARNAAAVNSPPAYDSNFAPSALSPTGPPVMSPTGLGRVSFPEANYNALH